MKCLALLSGGLDSILAIRLMQEQGIEVEAINFKTLFTCCQTTSARAAHDLGVRLTVLEQDDDYIDLVRKPMFGYGKGANPCIDCRIYMFEKAKRALPELGASFVVSGEVLGQRPKSQKRRDLEIIAHHSDLEGFLLRPLSAKLLPETIPEKEGWVDRERLHSFTGQSRKGLIELAKRLGIREIPTPSNGCALTEVQFSRKVFDLFEHQPQAVRQDFELLKSGRHFRWNGATKVIVGRNHAENEQFRRVYEEDSAAISLLAPAGFIGPTAMAFNAADDEAIDFAASLVVRYSKGVPEHPEVQVETAGERRSLRPRMAEFAMTVLPLSAE